MKLKSATVLAGLLLALAACHEQPASDSQPLFHDKTHQKAPPPIIEDEDENPHGGPALDENDGYRPQTPHAQGAYLGTGGGGSP
ncbi:hypothetical protein CSR02_13985 [Acetobacter pomorum]|uniref:Lipoprotein n=1 Tax=Acetobacter pomorum TaxID=65959 RepID=A0A2G4R944_9PROT|nr:hypothetical protein [Acetobacter pomorum]KDE20234.1 hypothetical protein AZ09_07945 [Acetobacter aceti 1023]PHY93027.1 hypothetical protein CSR02_13985 [Acetobacter pomorum]